MNRYSPKTKQLIDAAHTELSIARNRYMYTKHVYFARKLLGEIWRRILAFDKEQRSCPSATGTQATAGYASGAKMARRGMTL